MAFLPVMGIPQNITGTLQCYSAVGKWLKRRVPAVGSLQSKKDLR